MGGFTAFDPRLPQDKQVINYFLYEYRNQQKFLRKSEWAGKTYNDVTLEDIILKAMKDPTDKNGQGGNATAQVLFDKFNLFVEAAPAATTAPVGLNVKDIAKRAVYDAWIELRQREAPALKAYHKLRNAKKAEEASQCGSFLRRSSLDKYNLDKNATKLEEKLEEVLDPTPTLVHLIELSKSGWITWFLSKLRCYSFYSGNRTHSIFSNPTQMYIPGAGDAPVTFGIDTRESKNSEDIARSIMSQTIKK